jgi:gluconate:H+ symporter, GntP family
VGSLPGEPKSSHWVQAIELTTAEFGLTAGKIGVVIALASVISMCLMESGAADKVVRRFLAIFGEKRAGGAMVVSSYILSIPIFFDTFFMLLLPLARAMHMRLGKNYLLYVMAICCAGTLVGLFPVAISWLTAKWINRRLNVPMREIPGVSMADLEAYVA